MALLRRMHAINVHGAVKTGAVLNRKTETINSESKTGVSIWFDIPKKNAVSLPVSIAVTTLAKRQLGWR